MNTLLPRSLSPAALVRSALCRELSRMQEEGLLALFRRSFKLLAPDRLSQMVQ